MAGELLKLRQVGGVSRTAGHRGVLRPKAVGGFRLEHLPSSPDVADIVERHWLVEWHLPKGTAHIQEVLPHPCGNVSFVEGSPVLWGVTTSRLTQKLVGNGIIPGTKLRPGALALFAPHMAWEFTDRHVPLEDVLHQTVRVRNASSTDPRQQMRMVEEMLREQARAVDIDSVRTIVETVGSMLHEPADMPIQTLARKYGLSARSLQRKFRAAVGVGPKWAFNRYRLHEAAERLDNDPSLSLARLAVELGYTDQSHFAHDFTAAVGTSPAVYARRAAAP